MVGKIYRHFEEIVGSVLLVAMCVVAVLQVSSRYVFQSPFSWTEEVCTFLFIWVSFVGASLALRSGEHFAVEIIVDKLPSIPGRVVRIISSLLVILFTLLLIWFGCRLALTGWDSVTPALQVRRTLPYSVIPVGGLLMLIRATEILLGLLRPSHEQSDQQNPHD